MRKNITRLLISIFVLVNIMTCTNVQAKTKKEKSNMIWENYVNSSHYGNIVTKVKSGYMMGTYGGGVIYLPVGYKEAYKNRIDFERPSGKVIKSTLKDIYAVKASRIYGNKIAFYEDGTFVEARRQIYKQGDILFFQSAFEIYSVVATQNELETWSKLKYSLIAEDKQQEEKIGGRNWFGMLVLFVEGKMYFFKGDEELYLLSMDLKTKEISKIAEIPNAEEAGSFATDGENVYFYAGYNTKSKEKEDVKAYIYSIKDKSLKEDKSALKVEVKAPEDLWDDKYYISDASAMSIVKQNASNMGWSQVEKFWPKKMASWYVFGGKLYFQGLETNKEMSNNFYDFREWSVIDLRTGKLMKTGKFSPYADNMLINTIDSYRVILLERWSEVTNIADETWSEQYIQNWGLAAPTPD